MNFNKVISVLLVVLVATIATAIKVVDTNSLHRRYKRAVFGTDTRVLNVNSTIEKYPLSTSVRVGKCSGTLIWHRHVLTAAHCVSARNRNSSSPFVYSSTTLKIEVGLLGANATFRWIEVRKVFTPPEWRMQRKGRSQYDFAVLELEQPHGRPWVPMSAETVSIDDVINFSGYPGDKDENQKELWTSQCRVVRGFEQLILHHCDTSGGMSGAGVVINDGMGDTSRLIGVHAGTMGTMIRRARNGTPKMWHAWLARLLLATKRRTKRIDIRRRKFLFNYAVKLTQDKLKFICKVIGAGTMCEKITNPSQSEQVVP